MRCQRLCRSLLLVSQLSACPGEPVAMPIAQEKEFAPRFNVNLDEMVERPSRIWSRDDLKGEGMEDDIGHDTTLTSDGFLADGTPVGSSPPGEPSGLDGLLIEGEVLLTAFTRNLT